MVKKLALGCVNPHPGGSHSLGPNLNIKFKISKNECYSTEVSPIRKNYKNLNFTLLRNLPNSYNDQNFWTFETHFLIGETSDSIADLWLEWKCVQRFLSYVIYSTL